MRGSRLEIGRTQGELTQPALGLFIGRVSGQGGLVLLLSAVRVRGHAQQFGQLEMGAGEARVDLEGFAVMRDGPLGVALASQLVGHELVQARRSGRSRGDAQHGLIGQRRVNPVRRVQDVGIGRLQLAEHANHTRGFFQLARAVIELDQLHPGLHLQLLLPATAAETL